VMAWDARGVSDLEILRGRMRQFADDRDWGKFHDPKSVLLALVGEVGELAELFQWLPAADAQELAQHEPLRTRVGEEMSDVLLYLVLLADVIGIDLAEVERYRFDERALAWFARKVYTEEEMAYALRKRHWAERLAGFFAAKEATRKAFFQGALRAERASLAIVVGCVDGSPSRPSREQQDRYSAALSS